MLLINIAVLSAAAIMAYKRNALDLKGVLAAFLVGLVTLELGGIIPFLALATFLGIGTLATKYRFKEKAKMKIAEGMRGTRSWGNVFGNGLIAALLIVVEYVTKQDIVWAAAFSSIATANADTLASELGKVFGKNPRLITNLREKVKPGANGGVTLQGELFAFAGSFIIALIALPLFQNKLFALIAITLGGFLGCNADSVIGATIENRGWFNNDLTNFAATAVGALIGALIFLALGGV
ncbi:hypothetical protein PAP_03060 [Palaeococcus pacificus DY20341]|uniref:TIGR00297 family protein n=1 Tax=Palaeococcus pacificus DY20341 TaxID=1343739 RepID=A0A075LSU5_9EURY|nr:TIGR00297 family protein [Palaeococcus pacificus]AIF69032.1 hypothetical protein PAP_03060 [Palaeococcus pacificus DY20341]